MDLERELELQHGSESGSGAEVGTPRTNHYHLIKYVVRNDDEHCNVESSLLLLFIIRNLVYVQFLLQVAHL